jgi:hypothetical protein
LNHWLITFPFVALAWIFFRANNLQDAILICKNIFSAKTGDLFLGNPSTFFYGVIWILFLVFVEYITEYYPGRYKIFDNQIKAVRYAGYAAIVIVILLFGVFNGSQFIYFQF